MEKPTKRNQQQSETLKNKLEFEIEKIRDIIKNSMPYKGDTSLESQKVQLLNNLDRFEYSVNGIDPTDFIQLKED